jgi:PHD/YefM family antitoxin component YafN of YafNO toxin-antitoxin module
MVWNGMIGVDKARAQPRASAELVANDQEPVVLTRRDEPLAVLISSLRGNHRRPSAG